MSLNMVDDFEDDGASFRVRRLRQITPARRKPRLLVLVPVLLIAGTVIWFFGAVGYAVLVGLFS